MRLGADRGVSRFPAMPRAMLTIHLVRVDDAAWSIAQPATFHTLTTQPSAYTHAGNITALGLIVRTSAAACLLGQTCEALTNQTLPWSAITGEPEAVRLAEEIVQPKTDTACLQVLIASFGRAMRSVAVSRWQQTERLCLAVGRSGAQAGEFVGLGQRQLERRCLTVLGVSPKQFERLERFHRALASVVTHNAPPLAQVALDAGYYDQSHLALDARQLGGASVGEMKSLAAPDTPWWALSTPLAMRDGPEHFLL